MKLPRSQVIRTAKGLAKPAMAPYLFKIILLLALETVTGFALSTVISGLTQKFGLTCVVRIWVYRFDFSAALLTVLTGFLLVPLTLGVAEFLLKAFRRGKPRVLDVFLWYSDGERLKRVLEYYVYTVGTGLISLALYSIPAGWLLDTADTVLADLSEQLTALVSPTVNWSLVDGRAVAVSLGCMLIYALFATHLLLTPYYFLDHPEAGPFTAALRSWRAMRGHVWEWILCIVSFAGWYLMCALFMFLPLLYLMPYMRMTQVVYAEYVRSANEQNRTSPGDTPPEAPEAPEQ